MMSYPPTPSGSVAPYSQPPYPQPPAQPGEAPKDSGRRYQLIFGAVFVALTVLALALAAIAPDLGPTVSRSAPAGWEPVYQRDLTTADSAAWDLTQGCAFTEQGLDASASDSNAAICTFTPAGSGGATARGFYFELGIAPAAKVPAFQRALLLVGDSTDQSRNGLAFEIDQQGQYVLCDGGCTATSQATSQGIYITGGTAAWHGDAFVANTIAIAVSPDHTRETFYVNGQQVATVSVDMGAQPALAGGAPSGSEAVFTHATLSTGQ